MARVKYIEVPDESPDPNGWMLTFSDLITLLLTFFVLLLTMSSMDNKKVKENLMEMTTPFEMLDSSGNGTFIDPVSLMPATPRVDDPLITEEAVVVSFSELLNQEEFSDVQLYTSPRGVHLKFNSALLFEPGEALLRSQASKMLGALIPALNRLEFDVQVEGHAEGGPLPVQSRFASHLELATRRAFNVQQHLLGRSALEPARLSFRGMGRPGADEVEIVINTKIQTKPE
ncbi:OmpA family protein [Candidatus Sumerlaeota bacterium]|nr:OmpA family protein [Candidatus Sumerlaeota bacterium]